LALLAALAAALGLTACGRKGPLDPPPAASATGEKAVSATGEKAAAATGEQPAGTRVTIDSNGRPHAVVGPKKHIPLDVLLN
jgi:predicted small lipoprotein YifL